MLPYLPKVDIGLRFMPEELDIPEVPDAPCPVPQFLRQPIHEEYYRVDKEFYEKVGTNFVDKRENIQKAFINFALKNGLIDYGLEMYDVRSIPWLASRVQKMRFKANELFDELEKHFLVKLNQ